MKGMIDFEDIEKCLPGGQNMGGLPQVVYYANYGDVAAWPKRPAHGEGMTLSKMGELVGNLEMKPGKYMRRLYVTDGEGKLDIDGVGEIDGKSYVMKLRVYQPGLQSKLLGFINLAKNDNLVFIVPDSNGGFFLLGDDMRAAVLDSIDGMTTGQKTEERPGAGLVFSFKTANVYRYIGTIPLQGGGSVVPDPDPEPEGTVYACYPDGVDDYLDVTVNTSTKLGLLPQNNSKMIYTFDMLPGAGTLCSFGTPSTVIQLAFTGNIVLANLYYGAKKYLAYNNVSVDRTGQRVEVRFELSINENVLTLDFFVNDVKETCELQSEAGESPLISDCFRILGDGTESFFDGVLYSAKVTKNGVGEIAKWDFQGETEAERLSSKVNNNFALQAKNVADMNEFLKLIPAV